MLLQLAGGSLVIHLALIWALEAGEAEVGLRIGAVAGFAVDRSDYRIAYAAYKSVRKDEPAFQRLVDRTLNEMFQSGEIRRIYARWFATKELTVPMNQYLKEAFAVPNTYPAWP